MKWITWSCTKSMLRWDKCAQRRNKRFGDRSREAAFELYSTQLKSGQWLEMTGRKQCAVSSFDTKKNDTIRAQTWAVGSFLRNWIDNEETTSPTTATTTSCLLTSIRDAKRIEMSQLLTFQTHSVYLMFHRFMTECYENYRSTCWNAC